MMKMIDLLKLGTHLYNCKRWINYRCVMVFIIRLLLHHKEVQNLNNFFQLNPLRCEIITMHPLFFAQLTRQFFYKSSSTSERLTLITQSFLVLENQFTEQALQQIYLGPGLQLWRENYKEQILAIDLAFRVGEIKEGTMSLGLKLDNKYIYHINFWIVFDENNTFSLYIGALQGSRSGLSINKELTKHFLGCRPKNLIVYALRILAQNLFVSGIYAVSNYGFYANNHLRRDRKLKTSLDTFWTEIGGSLSQDRRFFILPVTEHRKDIEKVVSHKRNLYRKRFALLDKIAANIATALIPFMRTYPTARSSSGIEKCYK
ncbi:putative protein VirK/YbjX [Sporomusaceae bacterium BoRhaA]|uniref:VirK/YbjX family protein n=1 Tax=Pelorhabdus rhamnosifermentans TaxID=2772457 RepID=UPI001C06035B|nr:DUF535 family protein [Pelorhabdus rhamnosifermentans]MBU2699558.1 putative protein VirK/YbjX [Pelorhabdus rhamnosifermentans]